KGANGDVVLQIDIPANLFAKYEWRDKRKTYRESLIPASEVNKLCRPVIADTEIDGWNMPALKSHLEHLIRNGAPKTSIQRWYELQDFAVAHGRLAKDKTPKRRRQK